MFWTKIRAGSRARRDAARPDDAYEALAANGNDADLAFSAVDHAYWLATQVAAHAVRIAGY